MVHLDGSWNYDINCVILKLGYQVIYCLMYYFLVFSFAQLWLSCYEWFWTFGFKFEYESWRMVKWFRHTSLKIKYLRLVWTMHNICKLWGSNPGHHKNKKVCTIVKKEWVFMHKTLIWVNKMLVLRQNKIEWPIMRNFINIVC